MCRPTREEAFKTLLTLMPEDRSERTTTLKDDSQMYGEKIYGNDFWLSDSLWTGFVPHYGPVWTTLLGSPEEIAKALLAYKEIGVNEFIMSGWPEIDEMTLFAREVLPLVREGECRQTRLKALAV